ncbi:MAG: Asp-tRNA(Asn)/Glu-tRNA(Gln) amidotransferase GatCAB subunit A, partial [Deltaproteobacteria bacterium]|nr:Asp-tRNA(Asn)/Glu-tRNA(Gln) amidotransferase GatCAB subunit A [Deltaproteobacteria bacterium]
MPAIDVRKATITGVSELLKTKAVSPVEVIDAFLERIDAVDDTYRGFITVLEKNARKNAKKAEAEIVQGHYRGPLHGIPVSIKDNIYIKGV